MQNPLQITFHQLDKNEDIENIILEKFDKLESEIEHVTKCHVVLEKLSKHHQKGNLACVRLDLKVSHYEEIILREECMDDLSSLKSAVLKTFKRGIDIAHKTRKRHLENRRVPREDLPTPEPVESDE